jgi:mRNA interferase MazF
VGVVMVEFLQYDVYIFNPEPIKGHEVRKIRPCVIVSPNELNAFLHTLIIAPMTTKIRDYPFRPVTSLGNVKGCIMLDQLRCVDKSRLSKRIATLPGTAVRQVKDILREMLVD